MSLDFYAAALTILPKITPANPNYKHDVGLAIYKFVINIAGEEKMPKITGMLIDFSIRTILMYLQNFDLFVNYINKAQAELAQ